MKFLLVIILLNISSVLYGQSYSFDTSMIAYYPFNGNANDESINNFDGNISGNVTLTTDRLGNSNAAYSFGGGYIDIPNNSAITNLSEFTISAWIYPTDISSGNNTIISKVAPNRDFHIKLWNGQFSSEFAHTGPLVYYVCRTGEVTFLQEWRHVAATWNESTKNWKIYENGVLRNTCNQNDTPPWTGSTMRIGALEGFELFYGKLDDIRIYNITLTDQDISEIYYSENICAIKETISFEEGDLYIESACNGLILTSPNGTCFRIKVDNSGTLQTEMIECPD